MIGELFKLESESGCTYGSVIVMTRDGKDILFGDKLLRSNAMYMYVGPVNVNGDFGSIGTYLSSANEVIMTRVINMVKV